MGWAVVFAIKPMLENVTEISLIFLLIGGVFYTVGIVFYVIKRIKYLLKEKNIHLKYIEIKNAVLG